MKKIAFYVEGQTEQFFINKLLIEIAGRKNIQIELQQFKGVGRPTSEVHPKTAATPTNPKHSVLVLDCGGDGGVKARILEDYKRLFSQGYSQIIGIRDLYPLTDLARFEHFLIHGAKRCGVVVAKPLPKNTEIIIAVNEVESWFLAECRHFQNLDTRLNHTFITENVGFDPCVDDMTALKHPAAELRNIYRLVGKAYNKKKDNVERTVECLDYSNIYFNVRRRVEKLNDLITKIDNFLT